MRINKNNKSLYIQEHKHTPRFIREEEKGRVQGEGGPKAGSDHMPSVYVWVCTCVIVAEYL